jgi:hypothetical protein
MPKRVVSDVSAIRSEHEESGQQLYPKKKKKNLPWAVYSNLLI